MLSENKKFRDEADFWISMGFDHACNEWGHNLSVTLELSITIPDVSFTLIYDVYSTDISYDDCQMMIMIRL